MLAKRVRNTNSQFNNMETTSSVKFNCFEFTSAIPAIWLFYIETVERKWITTEKNYMLENY
jgi:hypothetical protein